MIQLNEIQKNIAIALKKCGIKQTELAKKLNISQSAIAHYIKGDITPSLDTFANICLLLDESADYLLGIDENKIK